jgi:hypothetical protein
MVAPYEEFAAQHRRRHLNPINRRCAVVGRHRNEIGRALPCPLTPIQFRAPSNAIKQPARHSSMRVFRSSASADAIRTILKSG